VDEPDFRATMDESPMHEGGGGEEEEYNISL
jgi:hypothetical protein